MHITAADNLSNRFGDRPPKSNPLRGIRKGSGSLSHGLLPLMIMRTRRCASGLLNAPFRFRRVGGEWMSEVLASAPSGQPGGMPFVSEDGGVRFGVGWPSGIAALKQSVAEVVPAPASHAGGSFLEKMVKASRPGRRFRL